MRLSPSLRVSATVRLPLLPLLGLLLACSTPLSAQDDDPPPVAAERPDAAEGVAGPDAGADAEPKTPPVVYLPYERLPGVIRGGETVVVPLGEYQRLRKIATEAARPSVPTAAIISRSEYEAVVEGGLARITATLSVQVLGDPWVEVPLRFGGAAVGGLELVEDEADDAGAEGAGGGDEPIVLLKGTGPGTYSLLFSQKGTQTVRLTLTAPVRVSPEGRSFELDLPPVGITEWTVTVPGDDQTIEFTPKLLTRAGPEAEGKTTRAASLGATGHAKVLWYPQSSLQPEMNLLTSAESLTQVSIRDGLIQKRTLLTYRVLRGSLSELKFAMPKGDRLLDVSATGLRIGDWTRKDEDERQVVTVALLEPQQKDVTLEVRTERALPEAANTPFDVVGLTETSAFGVHALDVVRESGQLVVSTDQALTLTVVDQRGLTRIRPEEVAEQVRVSGATSFRFFSPDVLLRLAVAPVEPEVHVTQSVSYLLAEDELTFVSILNYEVSRAGIFRVEIDWPEEFELDPVTLPIVKDFSLVEGTLILSLDQQRQGSFTLQLAGRRELDAAPDGTAVTLPIPEPVGVDHESGLVGVYAVPGWEVSTDEEQTSGLVPRSDLQRSFGRGRLLSGYGYARRPVTLALTVSRKPTRLSGRVATVVDLGEDRIDVRSRASFDVEHSGLQTFAVSVPEAVADLVLIDIDEQNGNPAGLRIAQKSRGDAEGGRVPFTITLQEKALGEVPLLISWRLPSPLGAGEENAAADLSVQPVQLVGLDADDDRPAIELSGLTGELVVAQARAITASAVDPAAALQRIDLRERKLMLPADSDAARGSGQNASTGAAADADRYSLAFRYFEQPVSLKLRLSRHDVQSVVETVISRALVETIVGRDQLVTYRCRYRMTSSERQRLPLKLPLGMNALGVSVNGSPAVLEAATAAAGGADVGGEAEAATDADSDVPLADYFVNVSRATPSDEPFLLTLLIQVPLGEQPFDASGGQITLDLPDVGGEGAVTQQQKVVVWVPDEFSLFRTPEPFHRELPYHLEQRLFGSLYADRDTDELSAWVTEDVAGQSASLSEFPTGGHHAYRYASLGGEQSITVTWADTSTYVWLFSGALFLIGLVLLRTTWANRITGVLLLVFVALLASLADHELVTHLAAAAAPGLLAVFVLWAVHGVFALANDTAETIRHVATRNGSRGGPAVASAGPLPPGTVVPPPGVFDDLR